MVAPEVTFPIGGYPSEIVASVAVVGTLVYAGGANLTILAADDADVDGIVDSADNCPALANGSQANNDRDAQGNLCDTDDDNDQVPDSTDNCPLVYTSFRIQTNTDGDALGDACDGDDDGDGVLDGADNCPLHANADQANLDRDPYGNLCDGDDDGDTRLDGLDNCPLVANSDQANRDGDGLGDVCDGDDDGDGVPDGSDNCPLASNADQADLDGDSEGNPCDWDDDGDVRADGSDNCPLLANSDQANADGDTLGDLCDVDDDGDGRDDGSDAFPLDPTEWADRPDGDGIGNRADPDDDNDGLPDVSDPFPGAAGTPPTVLLVDDSPTDIEVAYTESLDALGIPYVLWDTEGGDREPEASALESYPAAVWFAGVGGGGPGEAGAQALVGYLDGGGCLALSAPGYDPTTGSPEPLGSYFGVAAAQPGAHRLVAGTGPLAAVGEAGLDPSGQSQGLVLTPSPWGRALLLGDLGVAAVGNAERPASVDFFAVALEALPQAHWVAAWG
jgi:hypothetical protein